MRMKRATIFLATALLATGGVATYATTPSAYSSETVQEMRIAPYADLSSTKQLLMYLSQAESLVYQGDSTFAKMHINEALSMAARLPSSTSDTNRNIHRATVLTLRDGTVERELLMVQRENLTEPLQFATEDLPQNGYEIAKAEVHYIQANWDKEKLLVSLNNILREIEKGKPVSAQFGAIHAALLEGNEHTVSERRAAQDNIALARMLIRAKAYEPAKKAMNRADTLIGEVAAQKDGPATRFKDIATMRNEMATVSATIERNEPAAFKELDQKLEKWWNLLS